VRDDRWSESIAVGSLAFIDQVKYELCFRVEPVPIVQAVQPLRSVQVVVKANTKFDHRDVIESDGSYVLREPTNRREARGNRQQ